MSPRFVILSTASVLAAFTVAAHAQYLYEASPFPTGHASQSCCESHSSGGCNDRGMEACVCALDDYCCSVAWDQQCVDEVGSLGCAQCITDWSGVAFPSGSPGTLTVRIHSHGEPTCAEPLQGVVPEIDCAEWELELELSSKLEGGTVVAAPLQGMIIGADTDCAGAFGAPYDGWITITKFDDATIAGHLSGDATLPDLTFRAARCDGASEPAYE